MVFLFSLFLWTLEPGHYSDTEWEGITCGGWFGFGLV